jgi:hypothetical protein
MAIYGMCHYYFGTPAVENGRCGNQYIRQENELDCSALPNRLRYPKELQGHLEYQQFEIFL